MQGENAVPVEGPPPEQDAVDNAVLDSAKFKMPGAGDDPSIVHVHFRFFNDCGDIADVEAFASQDGVVFEPSTQLPAVEPYTVREAPADQLLPVADPRHFMILIRRNGIPVGTFRVGPAATDIVEAEAILSFDPASGEFSVYMWATDALGSVVLPQPPEN